MSENVKSFLKFVSLDELDYWDVKRYVITDIYSKFPLMKLSNLIQERSEKVKLFEEPEKLFGILGVNNKIGLFDAYEQYGNEINQAYKKVYDGDLAYNPYRINVGSIGLKTEKLKNDFISPAYVVFSSNEKLNPNYLYRIFKTNTFNKIINDNTTGSVRQNLKFDTLSSIKIPLPSIDEQNKLLEKYNIKIALAQSQEKEAKEIEQGIEEYLFEELGIEKIEEKKNSSKLQFIEFKNIDRWSVDYNSKLSYISSILKGKYNLVKLGTFLNTYQYGLSEKASIEKIGIPMLRMNNILDGVLDTNKLKYIEDTLKIKDFILEENDLLFNRTNSKELVGKTAIFEEKGKFTFASYLIRLKLNLEIVDINYINYLFNSSILQFQKDLVSRQTSGQANINAQELQMFLFPLPNIKIQNKIASEITKRKEKIKQLKQQALKNRDDAIKEFEEEIFNEA